MRMRRQLFRSHQIAPLPDLEVRHIYVTMGVILRFRFFLKFSKRYLSYISRYHVHTYLIIRIDNLTMTT